MKRVWLPLALVLLALSMSACQSLSSGSTPRFTYAQPSAPEGAASDRSSSSEAARPENGPGNDEDDERPELREASLETVPSSNAETRADSAESRLREEPPLPKPLPTAGNEEAGPVETAGAPPQQNGGPIAQEPKLTATSWMRRIPQARGSAHLRRQLPVPGPAEKQVSSPPAPAREDAAPGGSDSRGQAHSDETRTGERSARGRAPAAEKRQEDPGAASPAAETGAAPAETAENGAAAGEEPRRKMTAEVASRFELSFPGDGWIYLGAAGREAGVRFVGREVDGNETLFRFRLNEAGSYELAFQKQDSSNGELSRRSVSVESVEERPSSSVTDASQGGPGAGQESEQPEGASAAAAGRRVGSAETSAERQPRSDFSEAYAMLESGEKEAALRRFRSIYRGPNAAVAADIADLALELGREETAAQFYRSAAAEAQSEALASRAEAALFSIAAADEDWEAASQYVQAAVKHDSIASPETYLELSRHMSERDPAGAIGLLERYLRDVDEREDEDYVHYMLGKLYERESELRHMGKALTNYEIVTESYPLSRYYEDSAARIRYIERHYVEIR